MADLESAQSCPIKVMNPVPDNMRADEEAIENAKTSRVNVVVVEMHTFGETKWKMWCTFGWAKNYFKVTF